MTRRRAPGVVAAALAAAVLAGCSSSGSAADQLATIEPAGPAVATGATAPAAGTVRPVGAVVDAAQAVPGTSTVALLTASPERVLLLDTATTDAPRSVALPGAATSLAPAGRDGHVLVAAAGAVLDVDAAAGTVTSTPAPGDVVSVAALPDGRVAAGLADGSVVALGPDGAVGPTVGGIASADGLVVAGGTLHVLDRRQTALLQVDLSGEGSLGLGLRAGVGATTAVADRFGRVVVADTAGGQLLLFGTDPFLERQQYPVPGAPYALAYDATRNLVWVTLTATDEVVGYELTGGEPVERYRLPTVHEPDSVAVDPTSGVVVVGSAAGEGVAQLDPAGGAG
ncbi:lipoprotein [Rhodococcus aerolatus]